MSPANTSRNLFTRLALFAIVVAVVVLGPSAEAVASMVALTDADGVPVDTVIERSWAWVQVDDSFANNDPWSAEQVQVELRSNLAGDVETVWLEETGLDTGVFEGGIGLDTAPPGLDGLLQTTNSGPPDFTYDTITATYGPDSDTAQVVGSTTALLDADGNDLTTVAAGLTVYLTVLDANANDPNMADEAHVRVESLTTGDLEELYLPETGLDTGRFEAWLETEPGFAYSWNGRLQVEPGETIRAWHDDVNLPTHSEGTATVTGSSTELIDSDGAPVDAVLESSKVRVRVFDAYAGSSEWSIDTTSVDLGSTIAGDAETLTLSETGLNTRTFEGTISLDLSSWGAQWNGMLETWEDPGPPFEADTVTATHSDPYGSSSDTAPTAGSATFLRDSSWGDRESFAPGQTLYLEVLDFNAGSPGAIDTVDVHLYDPASPDSETVTLTETSAASCIYRGSIETSDDPASAGDGVLQVRITSTATAEHQDSLGWSYSTDTASVTAADVRFLDEQGDPTTEYLEATEARVRVFDQSANYDPYSIEQVFVALTTDKAGDAEGLTLYETGPDTSTFEETIGLQTGTGTTYDGWLQTTSSGPPDAGYDTITATYGSVSATAGTIGSRVRLLDEQGLDAESYPMGAPVFIRVEDHNADDPYMVDDVSVTVSSPLTGDSETLMFTETDIDSGVFEGVVDTADGAPSTDGILQVFQGETIRAEHADVLVPTSSSDTALITGSATWIIDSTGEVTAQVLESSTLRIRVEDHHANGYDTQVDMTTVDVTSLLGGDQEMVDLTETGVNTGIFVGEVAMALGSPASTGNGVLETWESAGSGFEPDTVTATHVDYYGSSMASATTIGSNTFLVDQTWQDRSAFAVGETVYVEVIDHNADGPGMIDTVEVELTEPTSGDSETLMLTETGRSTGIFRGSIPSSDDVAVFGDGVLQVASGGTLSAVHEDMLGYSSSSDSATIADSWICFIDADGQLTSVFLENSRAFLRVIDTFANSAPGMPDTTWADITSLYAGDSETVTLTETGPDTSVFEGSIELENGPQYNDGILQTSTIGPPGFTYDTLTATHGTESATATTSGSSTTLVDAAGVEVVSYPAGVTVYVEVVDQTANNPGMVDSVTVYLSTDSGLESESLTLYETGMDTGLFTGSIESRPTPPISSDGILQASSGEIIRAEHPDLSHPTSSSDTALVASSLTELIDADGEPVEVYLESSTLHVRVVDSFADVNEYTPDTTYVDLETTIFGDTESVTLTETGDSTSVFTGSIELGVSSSPSSGNGVLETREQSGPEYEADTITARHLDPDGSSADTASTIGSYTFLVDQLWQDRTSYAVGEILYLEVHDQNANNPGIVDSVPVDLSDPWSMDLETVMLTETGQDTGIFRGSIPTVTSSPSQYDGVLGVSTDSTITATHLEWAGYTTSTDTATVTESAVLFIDDAGLPTSVVLEAYHARLRALDAYANSSPSMIDHVSVDLTTGYGGDFEYLDLAETGPDTGIFEGQIDVGSGGPSQNSILEVGTGGPPGFDPDTITATLGTETAVARTVASTTRLLDWYGRDAETYPTGATIYIEVHDHNANSPGIIDLAQVWLESLSALDSEQLDLTETGPDTGVFTGSIPIGTGPVSSSDHVLQVVEDDTVRATHPNLSAPSESVDTAAITSTGIELIDADGNPTEIYLESSTVYVRVTDAFANYDPNMVDSTWTDLTTLIAGDSENIQLTETGPDTSIFIGSIPLELSSGASQWNGVLETWEGPGSPYQPDTITASHYASPGRTATDTATTVGSITLLTDSEWQEAVSFAVGETLYLEVHDQNYNDPWLVDAVQIDLYDPSSTDNEQLMLSETGKDTGIFRGSITTSDDSYSPGDGVFQVLPGTITAQHPDYMGYSSSSDTATITWAAVRFIDDAGRPATVFLESSHLNVRVIDMAANSDEYSIDMTSLDLASLYGGDSEYVSIQETGPDTGVFEGMIELETSAPSPDGVLQTGNSGSPAYTYDTLTATYGPGAATATAYTTGSEIRLLDEYGRDAETYAAGAVVYVRVTDHNANDPGMIDTVMADLETLKAYDWESLTLTETGIDTGIFEGSIPSGIGSVNSSDGTLQVTQADIIRAHHGDLSNPTESTDDATVVDTATELVNAFGTPAEVYLESSTVYVRVVDIFSNWDQYSVNTTSVELETAIAGDYESLQLTETGVDTGIFEGSIELDLLGTVTQMNGTLEIRESTSPVFETDTITATHLDASGSSTDSAGTIGSYTFFKGSGWLDADSYVIGSTVYLEVQDQNANDPGLVDTVEVDLYDPGSTDSEQVMLSETGQDTGIFRGSIATSSDPSTPSDGTFQVLVGSTVTAVHLDLPGYSSSSDSAVITGP